MDKPVNGRSNHERSSSPSQTKELGSTGSRNANIVTNIVEFADTLLSSHSDENAGYEKYKSCQAGDDKVDSVDTTTGEEEEGGQGTKHGQAGEANCDDVQDECREKGFVEEVDGILDVIGPVDVCKVQFKGTDWKLLVEHVGEVEAF